mmetsp:Transcript_26646/g.50067  ORF Transcript_26646/g.50067 Transcript_26646/m.50067 type:complete len:253 (-) Transcript_26646:235-993(-)
MSTGNPFGLSEISHYGSMRNVGGKAGGFINKKFFHPSSIRNQERLWKAITADAVEKRKQDDLEKAREEERKVEALRKEMYLAGQSSKAMFIAPPGPAEKGTPEQIKAFRELKRRKELLKEKSARQEAVASTEDDEDVEIVNVEIGTKVKVEPDESQKIEGEASSSSQLTPMVKSKYPEDVTVGGHREIWGSWYTLDEKRWGFACCQLTDFLAKCPHAPDEPEAVEKPKNQSRSKRHKKAAALEDQAETSKNS